MSLKAILAASIVQENEISLFELKAKVFSVATGLGSNSLMYLEMWNVRISLDSSQKLLVCGRPWVFRLAVYDGCALPSAVIPGFFQLNHCAVLLNTDR